MTLEVVETDALKLDARILKSCNFYHFRNMIAIPKMNDLIFRRRLFHASWLKRKQALGNILDFLRMGGRFNNTLLEEDLSIHRDYHLLFSPKDHLLKILSEEARWLPLNQTHAHHEKYALAAQLFRAQTENQEGMEDQELAKTIDYLNQKTPKVDDKWMVCCLQNKEEIQVGPLFLVPNEKAGDQFGDEVNAAVAAEPAIAEKNVGLCALGFTNLDPALMTTRTIAHERKLVTEIINILKANEAKIVVRGDAIDVTDDSWNTDPLPPVEA